MPFLDELVKMLSDYGLTSNQAKVYIAIAQLGIGSVRQVSEMSKVRREEVYRMLPKLEELGLIERILGNPIRIKATPVKEALSILIKREQYVAERKLSALRAEKDEFLKNFNEHKMKPKFEEAHFSLISQREAVMQKRLNMVDAADRTIDIITSKDEFSHFFINYNKPVKNAIGKGVRFRIVLSTAEHDDSILRIVQEYKSSKASLNLRCTDLPLCHYTVVDYREALLSTSVGPTAVGKNPYLWTVNRNLVDLLQRNFESVWHTSLDLENVETRDVSEKFLHFLKDLRPTDHILFLYESSEAKYNVLFNYIRAGLENGEAAVYIASDEKPSQIRDSMKRFGIEVEKMEKMGALRVLESNEFYIIKKKFDIATTIGLMHKMYNDVIASGFKGCRAVGEMACFFEQNLIEELREYEKALHRILDIPIIGICAYNMNTLTSDNNSISLYNELLLAHSTILFAGVDSKLGKMEIRKA